LPRRGLAAVKSVLNVSAYRFVGIVCFDWRLAKFSEFPAAFQAHKAQLEGKTIISFCTGGIQGNCFVFDEREALGPDLDPAQLRTSVPAA
jgi:UPF0176 protein